MVSKSKRIALFAASAGIMAALASFPLFPYQGSIMTVSGNKVPSVFYVDRCYERPALSIVDAQGFETVKSMTSGAPPIVQGVPAPDELRSEIYWFVLKPGSTGYIFVEYDFCPDWTKTGDKLPVYHNSTKEIAGMLNPMNRDVFMFKDKAPEPDNATKSDPLGGLITPSEDPIAKFGAIIHAENMTGVEMSVSDIAKIDDQSVKATYVIKANDDAEGKTYGISIVGACFGEILTIGDVPNENSMAVEAVKGPFYGCAS